MNALNIYEIFLLIFGGGALVGIYIWLGYSLYLVRTRAEEFAKYFANSPFIQARVPGKHDGIRSKLDFISAIGICIAFPKGHVARGQLSAQDLDNLPEALRRKFRMMYLILLGLIGSIVTMAGLIEIWGD